MDEILVTLDNHGWDIFMEAMYGLYMIISILLVQKSSEIH